MAATVRRVQATILQANTSRTPPGDIWVFSPSFDEQKGTTHLPLLRPRWRNVGEICGSPIRSNGGRKLGSRGPRTRRGTAQLHLFTVRSQLRFETVCLR